jgi:hypothetical protein
MGHSLTQIKETIMTAVYRQFGQVPFSYANGLGLSNNATTPNTKLDVAAGSILDSTQAFQLTLGSSVTINAAANGLNGLDTGSFAASTVYAVYLVADPVTQQATGAVISASLTGPLMPFGYSAYALIGYAVSDASTHFLKGYWTAGNSTSRLFMYDAPQATAITAGAATSYTAIDLSALVPKVDNLPVWIYSDLTPNAAGDTLKLQPTGATGDAITITGQVTTVHVTTSSLLYAKLSSSLPKVSYKVSSGTDAVAIDVAGFQFFI